VCVCVCVCVCVVLCVCTSQIGSEEKSGDEMRWMINNCAKYMYVNTGASNCLSYRINTILYANYNTMQYSIPIIGNPPKLSLFIYIIYTVILTCTVRVIK
jgi:hypothetical protein